MHVLYFHQYFQTPKGTSGTRSYNMAKALIVAGHSVTMVCGSVSLGNSGLNTPFVNGYRRGVVDGINVIEYELNYSNHLSYVSRTKLFIKFAIFSIGVVLREHSDIVFATSTPLTTGIIGIFARRFKNKVFVFEIRDLWPELPRAMGIIKNPFILAAMSLLEKVSYISANFLIALSPGIYEGIVKKGIDCKKIEMIPNGSDLDLFSSNISATRPKCTKKDDFLAIFTGTHGIANGLESVLDVALVLKRRRKKNIKIILIGDGKMKSKLKKRGKEQKLNNVIFLDAMSKTKLIGIMKAANVGLQILQNVSAFYHGTSPNKFFDYLAVGLPVLNNYPGWLADLIERNKCGYAIEPNNPEIFADKLCYLAENIDEAEKMGLNSKKLAQKEFDIKILGKKFVKRLEEVIK